VNLYTQEFFSLMRSRLNEGGIATFWLPINQLKVDEAKAILRAFHNAFPNASVWGSADQDWIMMGINGPSAERVKMSFVSFGTIRHGRRFATDWN
jgi:Spermidine synthase